jgi:TPR repeat protein
MSYTGSGVPLDYAEAARWTRAAADQGFARGRLDLAYLYEKGKGVPLDYVSAYMWYKSAYDAGEKQAGRELKSLSAIMTDEQIKRAIANAEKLPRAQPATQEGMTSETIGSPFIQKR